MRERGEGCVMAEIKTIHLCNPFLRCCNTCTAVTSFACFDIVLIPMTKRVVTVGGTVESINILG